LQYQVYENNIHCGYKKTGKTTLVGQLVKALKNMVLWGQ